MLTTTSPSHPWLALAATLSVQVLVTLALASASVLAPAVAPALGVAPESIGIYAGTAYLMAMLSGLRSGQGVAAVGAMRLTQWALLACGAGAVLAGLGPVAMLLPAAALIGVGYGLVNPAAAAVLNHHVPASARGLYFSTKQTGVPVGVALAGLLMPLGLVTIGWRATAVALGAACVAMALAVQPAVRGLEPPRAPPPPDGSWQLLQRVWRTPLLRAMSLASLSYAATQQAFVTFLVSMLNLGLGWTLALSAALLSASQVVSALARIGFGVLGDRAVPPGRVLVGLGLAMSLCCVALGGVAVAWQGAPLWALAPAVLACAATAMGWNGVFFAALALRVPRADLPRVSGATQFFTFAGGMTGPLLFGEAVRAGAGYGWPYVALAAVPAAAAWHLARVQATAPPTQQTGLSAPRNPPA
jgi:MFS family permease